MNTELLRMAEIEINLVNCFSFQFPIAAVGVKGKGIVEIVVEYGQSTQDEASMFAKIWARKPQNILSGYVFGILLPYVKNEAPMDSASRICDELNASARFNTSLAVFWTNVLEDLPDV